LQEVDVELRQLECLVAVAEERSFTEAARRLHLSQQAVSSLIRRLESAVGVTLFERTTRRVVPTEACDELVPEVRNALGILDRAVARSSRRSSANRPLRLAVSPAIVFGPLQDFLDATAKFGLANPEVREVWTDEIGLALLDGRFDGALGVEILDRPGLERRPWRRQRIDLLVAADHPFAAQKSVSVVQLSDTDLVMPERTASAGFFDKLSATFSRVGIEPRIRVTPRVSGPAPALVARGEGATVWLSSMDDRYVPAGLVHVPLDDPETYVTTSFVTALQAGGPVATGLELLQAAIEHSRDLAAVD
jgi:DNA-binding transcriptional LysR family regulator